MTRRRDKTARRSVRVDDLPIGDIDVIAANPDDLATHGAHHGPDQSPPVLLGPLGQESRRNLAEVLRSEMVGGALLAAATLIALVWANSPWRESYEAVRQTTLGPAQLGLRLSVREWANDAVLAIFFFAVGVELKREFSVGDLRNPRRAIVPIVAAIGGMVVPALIYLIVNVTQADGQLHGWAIPVATDIAFAVAVLAIVNTHLPASLRAFLLTLAVVDDLLGVIIIAIFYSHGINMVMFLAALAVIAVYGLLVQKRVVALWIILPVGVLAWYFMYSSGVHATIAGVILGFTVPARIRPNETISIAEKFEHMTRPVSAGIAVPLFALLTVGVSFAPSEIAAAVADPIAQGITLGLVLGKPIGIFLATYLVATFTHATLDKHLGWLDILAVGAVGGIGFTVSLLIGQLSFGPSSVADQHVTMAVLTGSLVAAIVGAVLLATRNRFHRASR